jgi:hypothetical protein
MDNQAMVESLFRRIARGVGALVGVLIVVVGVPAGLAASGAPRVPDRGEISGWLAGNGQFPTHSLWAVVVWLVAAGWLVATVALVLEAVGYARHRRATHIPRLGRMHRAAEWAVKSVAGMATMSAAIHNVPTAGALPLRSAVAVTATLPAHGGPAAEPAGSSAIVGTAGGSTVAVRVSLRTPASTPGSTARAAVFTNGAAASPDRPGTVILPAMPGRVIAAGTKVYVVEMHRPTPDTLWRIAQVHLGDPLRFKEIEALNVAQPQPDGRSLAPDGHWIYPGWVLVMPADAVGVQVVGDATPATGGAASAAPATPAASSPSSVPATSPPTTSSPVTSVPTTLPPGTAPAATTPAGSGTGAPAGAVSLNGAGAPASRSPQSPRAPAPVGATGSGWLAPGGGAGVLLATLALIEARRRRARALRRSRAGSVVPPTDPTVVPLLAEVPRAADVPAIERLQAALYHLATVADARLRPQVVLRHPDGRIDVQLFSRAEPIAPWRQAASNKLFWTLDPDAELPERDRDVTPCPALVQLGLCDDGAELYVDLEGLGVLGLAGTAETVRQVARALIATLVVSPSGDLCRVWTMGFDPYGLDEQVERRFVVAKSVDSLLEMAETSAREVTEAIGSEKAGSSFRLRAMNRDDDWLPALVVLAGTPLADNEMARLRRLAGDGGQGAAAVCADADAAWNLELVDRAGGWWRLNPLNFRVRPVQMALDELQELSAYLGDADVEAVQVAPAPAESQRSAPPGVAHGVVAAGEAPAPGHGDAVPIEGPIPDPPGAGSNEAPETPGGAPPVLTRAVPSLRGSGGFVERDWEVLVCTLGAPRAMNRAGVVLGDTGRSHPLQLLAWLVANRHTATRIGAREALWGKPVSPKTVAQTFHRAREICRELSGEEDKDFFPANSNGVLHLDARLVWDFELLADRLAYARGAADPAEAAEVLAGGLHLVSGVPCLGTEWAWPDDDHLCSKQAGVASALATELADLRIRLGQMPEAVEATMVGLRVIPNGDELTRLQIEAYLAAGERQEALAVFDDYERATAGRGEDIDVEIAKLRNQMRRADRS